MIHVGVTDEVKAEKEALVKGLKRFVVLAGV